jgi:hypothetical protein
MKKTLITLILSLSLIPGGCTDATWKRTTSLGSKHTVVMFSGGKEVGRWTTTGKPRSVAEEDGWIFVDSASGKMIIVTGDVVITTE